MSYIVVGIDGSPTGQAALAAAIEQASFIDAEVRIINVVMTPSYGGYIFDPAFFDDVREAAVRTMDSAVNAVTGAHGGDLPVKVTRDVVMGHIGTEIVRAADVGEGAAMVVVGSHGYGPIRSTVLGSVSSYLAHHVTRPLLIIPPSEAD